MLYPCFVASNPDANTTLFLILLLGTTFTLHSLKPLFITHYILIKVNSIYKNLLFNFSLTSYTVNLISDKEFFVIITDK